MKGSDCLFDSVSMKASSLNIAELIQFSPGFVGIQGRRLLIHDLSSLSQFRRDLIESIGQNMARRILTRKGLFWGQADSAGMQRLFNWKDKNEWMMAAVELIEIMGMAKAEVTKLVLEEKTIEIEIQCTDSVEVEQHQIEFGISSNPVCWVMAGYLSGYASYCLGQDIYFSESQCQGTKASNCAFIGKNLSSWGNAINLELPFFFAEDIQKKVRQLTSRISEQQRELAKKYKLLKSVQKSSDSIGIETRSKAYRNVLDLAYRVASFDTTILITGETGAGKEVLARRIHEISNRSKYPFLAVNCSALPESLLENELFGHKAGAFTGARNKEIGLFEAAQQGTIFLDEIGDISLATQVKLLRFLQSKEIKPVGETKPQLLDVRIISATNLDLDMLVKEGRFRKDLLYRLRVLQITVPPLRERPDDILPLARHFLEKFQHKLKISSLRLSTDTVDLLLNYQWPGNVRELENAMEHAAILSTDGLITPESLPGAISGRTASFTSSQGQKSLKQIETEHICSILEQTAGNRAETARILKISESTLYRRLRSLNILEKKYQQVVRRKRLRN